MSSNIIAKGVKASPTLADALYITNTVPNSDGYILLSTLLGLGVSVYWEDSTGWTTGEAWTYVSATSFSAVGDLTGKYAKGDKIRLSNAASTKYFYVIGVSFGAGITTLTLTGGSDYSLTAGAISAPSYSKSSTPAGFPQWFNHTVTFTGFSANPTVGKARFSIVGNLVTYTRALSAAGTSNATTYTENLPVTTANFANQFWSGWGRAYNSGAYVATPCMVTAFWNSLTLTFSLSASSAAWGSTLGKMVEYLTFSYEF